MDHITIHGAQKWTEESWKKTTKTNIQEKDEILFLIQEIGEIAQSLAILNGHKKKKPSLKEQKNLEKEFGDTFLSLLTLAIRYGVDVEKGFIRTKKSIDKRYTKK